ncbi:MAG: hypothetical protein ACRC5A_11990 [Enterobacteriaceae bacterium]
MNRVKLTTLYVGLITTYLMIGQAYSWDQFCVHMKLGTGFIGWIHVKTAGGYDKKGPNAGVDSSSCLDTSSIRAGTVVDVWVEAASSSAHCDSAPILQSNSHGTITYDAWGAWLNMRCSGPEGPVYNKRA